MHGGWCDTEPGTDDRVRGVDAGVTVTKDDSESTVEDDGIVLLGSGPLVRPVPPLPNVNSGLSAAAASARRPRPDCRSQAGALPAAALAQVIAQVRALDV